MNADGKFSAADLVIFQKWLLSVPNTKFAKWKNADLCKDSILDVFDICLMRKMLVKLK